MALVRQNFRVISSFISNQKFPIPLFHNIRNIHNKFNAYQKVIGTWFKKNQETEKKVKNLKINRVHSINPCRGPLPECPEHINTLDPSKCLEEGYGKRVKVKRRSWLNFNKLPRIIKEKPTNNPQQKCPKEETLKEYIFGPEKPPIDVRNCLCKKDFQYRCERRCAEPRLRHPDYVLTPGDVYVYTEPQVIKTKYIYEPEPTAPRNFKLPNAIICKKISDCFNTIPCRDKCTTFCLDTRKTILCPIHADAFRMPYEEMRPQNPRKKFFTCQSGLALEDVRRPPGRGDCACMYLPALTQTTFPPTKETCEYQEQLELRTQVMNDMSLEEASNKKMSRCERLKLIVMQQELKENLNVVKRPIDCEIKRTCKFCPKSRKREFQYKYL